ncbi:MAG: PDZ domain-containing protein, partial [Verrucomicrobiota bacterium]
VPGNIRGVLVANVDQNSNAADAGLRAGDIITEINRQPTRSAEEAVTLSEKASSDRLLLRVWRGGEGRGGMLFLSVDNTKRK